MATGYPRNDKLFHYTAQEVAAWEQKWNIPADKKVLLYTPTWRDSYVDEQGRFMWHNDVDLPALMDVLGKDYFLLFRSHHQIRNLTNLLDCPQIIDVSQAEDINELYLMSDLMITDYSSTMFDYANLKRPMVFHMFDRERYDTDIRGFYLPLEELPTVTSTIDELADAIRNQLQHFTYGETYKNFNAAFNPLEDGNSARRVVEQCFTQVLHKRSFRKM